MLEPNDSSGFDMVAIGASAGGIEALQVVIGAFAPDLPAAVLIVQHLDPRHKSMLAHLLGRHARLAVKQAEHDEPVREGTVYIAPPDMHLLVAGGHLELSRSKLVHFTRPSIDLLFESVAGEYGARTIGVVLTGSGMDGATGLEAIKRMGGMTIAQDPGTATHAGMPSTAIATGAVDLILPLEKIGPTIVTLVAPGPPVREGQPER